MRDVTKYRGFVRKSTYKTASSPTYDVTGKQSFLLSSALEFGGVDERGDGGADFPHEGESEWWWFYWYYNFNNTSSLWQFRKQNGLWITNRPAVIDHVTRDDTNTQSASSPFPPSNQWTLLGHRYSATDGTYDVHHNDNTTPVGTIGGITGAVSDFANIVYWSSAGTSSGWIRQRVSNVGLFAYASTAPTAATILARIYNGGNPTDLNADDDAAFLKGYWYFDNTLGDTASTVLNRAVLTPGQFDITLVNVVDADYIEGGQPQ